MYKENSRGPRVEPYGTPHTIVPSYLLIEYCCKQQTVDDQLNYWRENYAYFLGYHTHKVYQRVLCDLQCQRLLTNPKTNSMNCNHYFHFLKLGYMDLLLPF